MMEIPGKETSPTIRNWLIELGAWWRDDETPWCGVALAAWMRASHHSIPKHYYRARAWLDWGKPLREPALGAVVVFERGAAGHVGLVTGIADHRRVMVLGGNQGNRVSEMPFSTERLLGYRWPIESALTDFVLPVFASNAPVSTNEA